jgi:methylenetetrahydrofolate dehydrogenase (NADP+) / methenyltetrahydrofolate cyclohydrolase
MRFIDGRAIAADIRTQMTEAVQDCKDAGINPTLAVVVPNQDGATQWYVRSIAKSAAASGIDCRVLDLDPDGDAAALTQALTDLSADPAVHAIICQTPLPPGVTMADVGTYIDVRKDVDGANPASLGGILAGQPTFAPATADAVREILRHERVPLVGARVTVVGRSTVVGKPAALLLLAEHATVTVCHSRTRDLANVCAEAEILVAAIGKAGFVSREFVRPGAVVIDVGTNPTADGGLVGDVDPAAVADRAAVLTPVPGGVGPVTTALLLRNTIVAARSAASIG